MKKIKFLMLAFVAACASFSFVACDDDEKIVEVINLLKTSHL